MRATALALEGALRFPATFHVLLSQSDAIDVLDVMLQHTAMIGQPLRRIRLPGNVVL